MSGIITGISYLFLTSRENAAKNLSSNSVAFVISLSNFNSNFCGSTAFIEVIFTVSLSGATSSSRFSEDKAMS